MNSRPYTVLSCAVSIDGYLDDASDRRLLLSNVADFDRVDAVRAGCDAILVGAGTIRADNPRLMVRSQARRDARVARGLPATPVKVTVTVSGDLDPATRFFTTGGDKIVYCATSGMGRANAHVAAGARARASATIVDAGEPVAMARVLDDLATRGIRRLMVEGGGSVHTQFLTADLADELHLVVAPFFVGDSRAPRFAADGAYPWTSTHRARLIEVRPIGDVVLHRYALSARSPLESPQPQGAPEPA